MKNYKIIVYGIVQGVGFRPFVYKLAREYSLKGYVNNAGSCVEIVIQCGKKTKNDFISALQTRAPQNAKISDIIAHESKITYRYKHFRIKHSRMPKDSLYLAIPQDVAVCEQCKSELADSRDRRFGYAFINCINCGPRYTIIEKLPYDRENTTMKHFAMCEACHSEYIDIVNRRFHAQPNSCPSCGIECAIFDKNANKLALDSVKDFENAMQESAQNSADSTRPESNAIILFAREALKNGKILALKGVGGFNIVCKAEIHAPTRLRKIKNRPAKPFAIMFANIDNLKQYFHLSTPQERALRSPQAPIVLLQKSQARKDLSPLIAPNISTIGVILAYSPLHVLLLQGIDEPLIFTSANVSGEPLICRKEEIFRRIEYDYLFDYNRDISNALDDSLLHVLDNGKTILLRAARGFYPLHLRAKIHSDDVILALGAHQKSQIALYYKDSLIISPYIGDLDNVATIERFRATIKLFLGLYNIAPNVILCDKHPLYASSTYARELASNYNAKIQSIYHHRAHVYSCLLDNALKDSSNTFGSDSRAQSRKILGVIFDGTGLGEDGNIWGGEFFVRESGALHHIAHFKYFPLLGGENAIKDIKRLALGLLFSVYGREIPQCWHFDDIDTYYHMFCNALNSPLTSSVGRLFDCVAWLCGALESQTYEGQSGMILEALYDASIEDSYPFEIQGGEVIIDEAVRCIVQKSNSPRVVATKFINTLAEIIITFARKLESAVLLSGGVFQNKTLCDKILSLCERHNIEVLLHEISAVGDGGIALGQIGAFMCGDTGE